MMPLALAVAEKSWIATGGLAILLCFGGILAAVLWATVQPFFFLPSAWLFYEYGDRRGFVGASPYIAGVSGFILGSVLFALALAWAISKFVDFERVHGWAVWLLALYFAGLPAKLNAQDAAQKIAEGSTLKHFTIPLLGLWPARLAGAITLVAWNWHRLF